MIRGDDGYDEMFAWVTRGVAYGCHWLMLLYFVGSTVITGFAATFGEPMMTTVNCQLVRMMATMKCLLG